MIRVGSTQTLIIDRFDTRGARLVSGNASESKKTRSMAMDEKMDAVWLASPFIPKNVSVGQSLSVFVFTDHYGNLVASMKKPSAEDGDIAYLKVKEVSQKGAFLDWQFMTDLFAPNDNIFYPLKQGKSYLFRIFVNRENRIRATTDIYDHLKSDAPHVKDDRVEGIVYKKLSNGGVLVAVDRRYYGLIPKSELYADLDYGESVSGRVIRVREDGKLDLSIRKKIGIQMMDDSEVLLKMLNEQNGKLELNDRSDPEQIKSVLKISKKAFKRAVGRLLKDGFIIQTENGIELKK